MDIAQLKTLIHVAELGSLRRAADRLDIGQPALSRQIRMLEEELGAPLFQRHGRGMVPTEIGREVLDHAGRIVAEMEALRLTASSSGAVLRGKVLAGVPPTVAEVVTVPLVDRIRSAHPQLGVRLSSAFSGYLLDWLQRGDIEVAFSYDPKPSRALRIVPVMEEELLLVAPGGSQSPASGRVEFSELARRPLVLPSPPHGLRAILEDCARRAGITLEAPIEADSLSGMVDLVRNGFGVTVLPLAPVYPLVQSGVLVALPLANPTPVRTIVLAHSADRRVSAAARFVGQTFIDVAADLVARGIWAGRMLGP